MCVRCTRMCNQRVSRTHLRSITYVVVGISLVFLNIATTTAMRRLLSTIMDGSAQYGYGVRLRCEGSCCSAHTYI